MVFLFGMNLTIKVQSFTMIRDAQKHVKHKHVLHSLQFTYTRFSPPLSQKALNLVILWV
jgi:hypothetical protein